MTELTEISRRIGRLEASAESTLSLVRDMHERVEILPTLHSQIHDMRPHVADYLRMKNRAVGIIFGISIAAGTLGSAIKDALLQTWKS